MQPRRLAIFGVGLLGGSIGLAMRSVWPNCAIVGYGHRSATLEQAKQIGAIDEFAQDATEAARDADLVILCTPVGVLADLLKQVAPMLTTEAIVTDVGSTKRSVVAAAEKLTGRFVGSHPMAGSEKRGVEFARADLFQGARCIVTPTPRTDPQVHDSIEGFWRKLGMNVVRLSPQEHDRLVCGISHLPHAVAAALVAMQSEQSLALAGKGFLDTTRVSGGDGGLWRDILLDNADNLQAAAAELSRQLEEIVAMSKSGRGEELRAWLDSAAARRQALLQEKLRELES